MLSTVPESYLLADKALYLFSFNKVKEAISPDGVISDAGARTALKVIPTFNPEVKAKEIKLELTYTNEFVKKAKAMLLVPLFCMEPRIEEAAHVWPAQAEGCSARKFSGPIASIVESPIAESIE